MEVSNPHNLYATPPALPDCRFGVRVTLPPGDPLRAVLGDAWHRDHWYATRAERDAALREMGRRHPFSRGTDTPRIVLETLER